MSVSQIVIRPADEDDWDAVHAIHRRAVEHGCAPLLTDAAAAAWLARLSAEVHRRNNGAGGETYRIAESRGLRAGFASWAGEWLMALYVDPDHQGEGIGRALLAACHRAAGGCGGGITRLNATLNAREFYEAAGFRVTGEGHEEMAGERIPHLRMLRL